jgi:hypothetical protein
MGKKKKQREINGQKKRKFEIHDDVAPEIYDADDTPPLGSFRIGQDEKPGVLFTRKHQAVNVHYCSESELKCYVLCNSDDDSDCCLLCQIGKKINKRLLYPVVSLETGNVEVLPVSDSLRPYALLPQVLNILSANKRVATFFSQENYKYSLKNFKLSKTERNMISSVIKSFQKSWKVREIDLASVYQHISNSILANYSEIKKKADLKRIKIDSDDE